MSYFYSSILESALTWSSHGCHLVNDTDGYVVCSCDHLTNFAALLVRALINFVFHIISSLSPPSLSLPLSLSPSLSLPLSLFLFS